MKKIIYLLIIFLLLPLALAIEQTVTPETRTISKKEQTPKYLYGWKAALAHVMYLSLMLIY